MIPDKVYNVLKWLGLIFFPAAAVLVGTVGPVWGLANTEAIVATLNAVGLFIGALIGATSVNYNKKFNIYSVEKGTIENEVSNDD
jgi:hypothetical protein